MPRKKKKTKYKLKTHKATAKRFRMTAGRQDRPDEGRQKPLAPAVSQACQASMGQDDGSRREGDAAPHPPLRALPGQIQGEPASLGRNQLTETSARRDMMPGVSCTEKEAWQEQEPASSDGAATRKS